jgi:hypothetical protein
MLVQIRPIQRLAIRKVVGAQLVQELSEPALPGWCCSSVGAWVDGGGPELNAYVLSGTLAQSPRPHAPGTDFVGDDAVGGGLSIFNNDALCQSLVDAFIDTMTALGWSEIPKSSATPTADPKVMRV